MAIERAYKDRHGTEHPTAYHRVVQVELRAEGAQVIVGIYPNKAASDARLPVIDSLIFNAGTKDPGRDDVEQVPDDPDDPSSPTQEVRTPTVVDNLAAFFSSDVLGAGTKNPLDAAYKAAYAFIKVGTEAVRPLVGKDV